MKTKLVMAVVLIGGIVGLDVVTKRWALEALNHGHTVPGLGSAVPFTLAFNEGIAFGLPLPSLGRWLIVGASVVVLGVLASLIVKADERDWLRLFPSMLVSAGAIGNLIDRLRWDRGVVDFIGPIDLGFMYWPIFNVADMAITTGAILLAISLWREESAAARAVKAQPAEERGG